MDLHLQKLLKTEMSRKEFLGLGAFAVASLFGVIGLIRQLNSHAATATADLEAEDGTTAGGATKAADSTASGGNAVKFGAITTGSTPWLPFDMPSYSTLKSKTTDTANGVFIHAFSPLQANYNAATMAQEYGDVNYLPPGRTADQNFGGAGRDWAPWRAQNTTDTSNVTLMDGTSTIPLWRIKDYMSMVEAARSSGVDGFFISVQKIAANDVEWERTMGMVDAINRVNAAHPTEPKFWAILRNDGITSNTSDVPKVVSALTYMWSQSCAYKTADGKLLVSPLNPESAPADTSNSGDGKGAIFWKSVQDAMTAASKPINIWPVYVKGWTTNAPDYDGFVFGHSRWADGQASSTVANSVDARGAAAISHNTYSKPWMAPVRVQDVRPRAYIGGEAGGFDNLVGSWASALQTGAARANWVNIPTFNDWLESSSIGPSRLNGNSRSYSPWLDINSYYLTWFKMGAPPTIVRDALYVANRRQVATGQSASNAGGGTTITGPQTDFTVISGMKDEVAVLAFAKVASTVEITTGGVKTTVSVQPGVTQVKAPARVGAVTVVMKAGTTTVASVTADNPIVSSLVSQDMTYYATSSLR